MRLPKFRYSWREAAGDFSGGLIAALIALPYGLAMAALMGLPPASGLFTSVASAPVTALLGRNPVMIGGPSAGTVPFIADAVREHGAAGAAKIVLAAAVFLLMFSTLRLGRYAGRIPPSVVSGFSCGIGAMMVISQLRTVFGLESLPAAGTLLHQLTQAVMHLGDARWEPSLLAGIAIFASTLAAQWSPRLPAPLLGLLAALASARLLGFGKRKSACCGWSCRRLRVSSGGPATCWICCRRRRPSHSSSASTSFSPRESWIISGAGGRP